MCVHLSLRYWNYKMCSCNEKKQEQTDPTIHDNIENSSAILISYLDLKLTKYSLFSFSFAQWRYHSQWGFTEAWLLLVENYSQYPAQTTFTGRLVQFMTALTGAKLCLRNQNTSSRFRIAQFNNGRGQTTGRTYMWLIEKSSFGFWDR